MVAEALIIALAVSTLTSGFVDGFVVVSKLKERLQERQERRRKVAKLEKLENCLDRARSTVQETYDNQYLRHGQKVRVGDDLAQYVLFALAARQESLVRRLRGLDFDGLDIQPLISAIETTKTQATKCLNDLAARASATLPPSQVTFPQKAALLREFQGLCPSAALYRDRLVHRSSVGNLPTNRGELTCHECGAKLIPTKLRIPNADESSCVLITLSGLFRAHCSGTGGGFTCIWQLREASCYGVFDDEKALLKHMLTAHFRDGGTDLDAQVDWPADDRRGDLDKSGFMVHLNGVPMQKRNGILVIPTPRRFLPLSSGHESGTTSSTGDPRASFHFTQSTLVLEPNERDALPPYPSTEIPPSLPAEETTSYRRALGFEAVSEMAAPERIELQG